MEERLQNRGIPSISKSIELPIKQERKGIRIGERFFPQSIALIGDGTGLEAIKTAVDYPEAAIIIVDPFVRFAKQIYSQLKQSKTIDWSFFRNDSRLPEVYDILSLALDRRPNTVKKIEEEFLRYRKNIPDFQQRIFMAPKSTHSVSPEFPMFDHIQITYPEGGGTLDEFPPLFSFINRGLKQSGTCQLITDILPLYLEFLNIQYKSVSEHGVVKREKGIVNPVSVYDLLNGESGYYYVNLINTGKISEPNLFNIIAQSITHQGLFRDTFGGKKRNIQE